MVCCFCFSFHPPIFVKKKLSSRQSVLRGGACACGLRVRDGVFAFCACIARARRRTLAGGRLRG